MKLSAPNETLSATIHVPMIPQPLIWGRLGCPGSYGQSENRSDFGACQKCQLLSGHTQALHWLCIQVFSQDLLMQWEIIDNSRWVFPRLEHWDYISQDNRRVLSPHIRLRKNSRICCNAGAKCHNISQCVSSGPGEVLLVPCNALSNSSAIKRT